MAKLTPEQEARYALAYNVSRSDLPAAAQLEYDRLKADQEREAAARASLLEHQKQARQDQGHLDQERAGAWRDLDQQPGTRLRWERVGVVRRELRTAEQETIAFVRYGWPTTISAGGRTFTRKRIKGSSPPWMASSRKPNLTVRLAVKLTVTELVDETGMPVLYTSGRNYNYDAGARITFPDQRWLRFPVRGANQANAIMTAENQTGNEVARYRTSGSSVEIIVRPGQSLTDELVLALALSAPWLNSFFSVPNQGGGG
jgi:hypothetical protein